MICEVGEGRLGLLVAGWLGPVAFHPPPCLFYALLVADTPATPFRVIDFDLDRGVPGLSSPQSDGSSTRSQYSVRPTSQEGCFS